MRIALVIGTLGVGGTETQLCRLARELRDRGHEVKVFALISGGPMERHLVQDSIPFEIFGFPGFAYRNARGLLPPREFLGLRALLNFFLSLRRFRPDVCHAFLPWAYMLAMPAAALLRIPARVAARRSLTSQVALERRWGVLHYLSMTASHAVVANSIAVQVDSAATERGATAKLRVIANGVDLPGGVADPRAQPAVGLMVANLIAYKGHRDVIEALTLMPDPPRIRFIGDGPERQALAELVDERGLGDIVAFEGSVPGAARVFREAQFGILASHHEGLPNAVLEAMGAGLPLVATAVGGVPELVEEGVNGLLVPPHDPAALAVALKRIANDPELRKRLGDDGRRRAAAWDWPKCVDLHEQLYRQLLGRAPREDDPQRAAQ